MQWCIEVPFSSSFPLSSFPNHNLLSSLLLTMTFILNMINLSSSSVHTSSLSACSPYFISTNIDIRTTHQYIQPCPVSTPCQCLCELESKRLWIDCFYRQMKTFPTFVKIPTNKTRIEWNIDLAFNQFDTISMNKQLKWIPDNMHIRHLVLSGSLAYDLIVQLNLTHRNLIDVWPIKRSLSASIIERTRLLTELTLKLREKSKRILTFNLSLSGEPPPISSLYLDHNSLDSIPLHALYNATGLYEIYLSFNNIVNLPAYAFGFAHRLTRVDLSYNRIISIDNSTFQRHPNAFAGPFLIDYLDLSHNQINLLEANVFSYLVNLRLLKLEHNQIRSISAHIWTGLYRLKYLDLSHNSIENFTQAFYSGYLDELNHLKMTSNNLTQIGSCEFLSLKRLTKLNLSGNNLTTIDTCSFYGLHQTTKTSPLNVYLSANQLETIHPCTFKDFARSTIYLENNPLICNCSFNYLLQNRQSVAYTGQECRAIQH
ncbi:hypothetical protein I4U23_028065 [Adineta vaga]|nr:hypothetical protein I4U23_028065 [Adineta vaga]